MTTVTYKCTAYTTEVRWKIEKFSVIAARDQPKKILYSRAFALFKSRLKFYLMFYPTDHQESNSVSSSLYLMPRNLDGEESIKLSWKFWIENVDGEKVGDQTAIKNEFSSNKSTGYGYSKFVTHAELYPPSQFAKNDIVFVCCSIQRSTEQPDFKPIELDTSFYNNMWLFYQQGNEADECTIQIGTKNFKIKKRLLTELSDTFKQMFNSDLEESRTNVVKIKDVKPATFKAFIQYVYKGYLDSESIEYVEDLYLFADKYFIEKLKSECSSIMRKNVTKDNVLSRLVLANTHNDAELKDHLLAYIMNGNNDTNWRSILNSEELHKLRSSNKQLANEISNLIFDKIAGAMSKTS